METVVTAAVIIVAIVAGMFLIHRLNAQHDERIGAFPYSDALPGIRRRNRKRPGTAASDEPPWRRHTP
ncbi:MULTISPECIES: hypothetical protein [unclassified Streptomyces]|uniref:hypothetical protein n=1 Tax=unclassified Streptomyces TaxID=2593676 RepID=UPI0023662EB6|nr:MULTISPECIES: hypothetical protein [unclassified Streptomyces]MDF3140101.1 hypothetical protein [Streptomyces sp. T21Q-yed]WDF40135.1 hypothetical protein PBV52_26800 [Streptomyces sp. T12]